jgi:hypothetical protein
MSRTARFANVLLCFMGSLTTVVAIYLMYQHGWSPLNLGIVVIAVLIFIGLRLPHAVKATAALLVASVGLCIYGAEATLHYLPPSELVWEDTRGTLAGLTLSHDTMAERVTLARQLGQPFDPRTPSQVIHDLEVQGLQAYPPSWSSGAIEIEGRPIWPLGGISDVLTLFCNEIGEYTIYHSDEHGFHNPKGLWDGKAVDIVVLGESFTHGACVPSEENFVALIRNSYPHTLNLGMTGMSPLRKLAALKEYAAFVRPRLVLWVYFEGADIKELFGKEEPFFRTYLTHGALQGLLAKQAAIDRTLKQTYRRVRPEIEEPGILQEDSAEKLERFLKLESRSITYGAGAVASRSREHGRHTDSLWRSLARGTEDRSAVERTLAVRLPASIRAL